MPDSNDGSRRTIPEVNRLVRALVEQETIGYPFWIRGIVSRYYLSDFGHAYFDLTDEDYTINCILPERRRGTLDFEIASGLEVEVFGSIQVYEKQAKIQIDVEQVRLIHHEPFTVTGSIQEQLAERGCWPPVKRPMPPSVRRIGLITSKHSDALHDFENTYRSESGRNAASVQVIDVRLQGQQAPAQIAEAIERLNREKAVDAIAIVRGGGSTAELAVFNDLAIAEAIFRSSIPIVTGIGHQRDDTLADQMADLAAITPTAAALELARLSRAEVSAQPSPAATQPKSFILMIALAVVILFGLVAALLLLRPL
jgi:exodeoxyribonuclease VII large subunit